MTSSQNIVPGSPDAGCFVHAGEIESQDLCNIQVEKVFDNVGKIFAKNMTTVRCGTLRGDGLFQGDAIQIITKNFQFAGAIDCKKGLIITSKPFDPAMCAFNGFFRFVVDSKFVKDTLIKP